MSQTMRRWRSPWQQSGLELQNAMLAATTSSMAIAGLVQDEMMCLTMKHPDESTLAWLPNVRTMIGAEQNREANFELVVRSLFDGLHSRLVERQGRSFKAAPAKKTKAARSKKRTA